MKRRKSKASSDLCGSFLVNVLDLGKILDKSDKNSTMRKLSCLKELLDISSESNQSAIVISDSEEEEINNVAFDMNIKKEYEDNGIEKGRKGYSSESDDDDTDEISKVKDYVKKSLLEAFKSSGTPPPPPPPPPPITMPTIVKSELKNFNDNCPNQVNNNDCSERCKNCEKLKSIERRKRRIISTTKRRHSSFNDRRVVKRIRRLRHKSEDRQEVSLITPAELVPETSVDSYASDHEIVQQSSKRVEGFEYVACKTRGQIAQDLTIHHDNDKSKLTDYVEKGNIKFY